MSEDLLEKAISIVLEARYGSTALLQRKLRIRYFLAVDLLQKIEDLGIISKPNGAKPRKILS